MTPTTISAATSRMSAAAGFARGGGGGQDTTRSYRRLIAWWRVRRRHLVDTFMDAIAPLADDGLIWVLTPNTADRHVVPAESRSPRPNPTDATRRDLGDLSAILLVSAEVAAGAVDILTVVPTAPDFTRHEQNRQPVP